MSLTLSLTLTLTLTITLIITLTTTLTLTTTQHSPLNLHPTPNQVWDPALVGTLRLAASGLLLGHAAVAVFGVTLVLGAPPSEKGQEKLPVLWFLKLLVTGPAGLLSLQREIAGE